MPTAPMRRNCARSIEVKSRLLSGGWACSGQRRHTTQLMSSRRLGCLATLAAVALAGCGDTATPTPVPTAGPDSPGAPAILTEPKRAGEIVVTAEASPQSHGPFRFDGRYRVRFAQFAPEDPDLDFTQETTFVVELGPRPPARAPAGSSSSARPPPRGRKRSRSAAATRST